MVNECLMFFRFVQYWANATGRIGTGPYAFPFQIYKLFCLPANKYYKNKQMFKEF